MNAAFVWIISILVLGSTVFAFLYNLAAQGRHHQSSLFSLFKTTLAGEGLVISFAMLFLTCGGTIIGTYLAWALSSLLGIHEEYAKFVLGSLGFIVGLFVTRFVIVSKIVIPKLSQPSHNQEGAAPPPSPPQEP